MYKDEENRRGRRRTQAERREGTRRAFVAVARELFAEKGYAEVPIEDIVGRTGMTKGALYHHFSDKKELFRVVTEEIEKELDEVVLGAARERMDGGGDPFEVFMAAISAYLDACLRADVRQILLLDGPAVLGWREWREADAAHAVAQIEAGLQALVGAGLMEPPPLGLMARMVHGALIEAALYVAASHDTGKSRAEAEEGLRQLIEGLSQARGEDTHKEESDDPSRQRR